MTTTQYKQPDHVVRDSNGNPLVGIYITEREKKDGTGRVKSYSIGIAKPYDWQGEKRTSTKIFDSEIDLLMEALLSAKQWIAAHKSGKQVVQRNEETDQSDDFDTEIPFK